MAKTSGKPATLPSVFTCSQEGDYIISQEETDKVKETLIALSQDMGEIISLDQARNVFKQERLRAKEAREARKEAEIQTERFQE